MLKIVYRLLLTFIHYIYSLIDSVHTIWAYLTTKVHHAENLVEEERYIISQLPQLRKIPKHIVIILGTEKPSYVDIARLIVWCSTAGIPQVSVYDYKGNIKKASDSLQKAVGEAKRHFLKEVTWNNVDVTKPNKVDPNKKLTVSLFSFLDGQRYVIQAAQEIAQSDLKEDEEVTVRTVDKYIKEKIQLNEPDCGIICGGLFSTYGFLPWHTRTTQFVPLKTHHNVKVGDFLVILSKFALSEQRWGK